MNPEAKRKRRGGEDENGGDSFTVLFTSLGIIMLAFFILLNSMAVLDNNRKLLALGSLTGTFNILPGGRRFTKGDTLLGPSSPILNKEGEEALDLLTAYLSARSLNDQVKWYARDNGVVLTITHNILFPSGSTEIPSEAQDLLERVAHVIRHFPNRVQVEGHTDIGPLPSGADKSTWKVSGLQAVRVVRYLTEKLGLDPRRFSALNFGPNHPLVANTSPENRARNRRVDIVLRGNFQALKSKVIDVKGFLFPVKGVGKE